MSALICGSAAYDNIMVFEDKFKNHILPDQIHILNVAFLVPKMRREFGGCAMNIAYNLKLLGEEPIPMATTGQDFKPYADWFSSLGICQDHVRVIEDVFTAQAFITTDIDDNQITAFHPGAMNHSQINQVSDVKGVTIGIVSPDGRNGMLSHAEQFSAADMNGDGVLNIQDQLGSPALRTWLDGKPVIGDRLDLVGKLVSGFVHRLPPHAALESHC